MKPLSAAEARRLKKAVPHENMPTDEDMQPIMDEIRKAAEDKKDRIFKYQELSRGEHQYLVQLGYVVKSETDRDGLLVTISW